MRVGVVPGSGVVVRRNGTVVVIGPRPAPSAGLPGALIEAVAEHSGADRLRQLARLVLAEPEPVAVAVATIEGGEVSVLLFGDLDLDTPAGRVSGRAHVLGVTETVPLAAGFAIVAAGNEVPELADWNHLESGSVRGDGVVVATEHSGAVGDRPVAAAGGAVDDGEDSTGPTPVTDAGSAGGAADDGEDSTAPTPVTDAEPVAPESPAGPTPVTDAEPVAPESPTGQDSFTSVRLTPDADLSERQPLPIAGRPDPSSAVSGPLYEQPVEVIGVYSPRGFFNHPDAKYCSRTGVKMGASQTKVLTRGPRPPLGVITLDDGSTLTVRWNTVIGRDPELDERVHRGEVAPFVVTDIAQSVSRRHALLELVDWDVLISDLGSRNKTWIQDGPDDERRPLAAGERTVLRSGTTVHLGDRSFVFNEHHVR